MAMRVIGTTRMVVVKSPSFSAALISALKGGGVFIFVLLCFLAGFSVTETELWLDAASSNSWENFESDSLQRTSRSVQNRNRSWQSLLQVANEGRTNVT